MPGWALFGGLGIDLGLFVFPLKMKVSNLLKKKKCMEEILEEKSYG